MTAVGPGPFTAETVTLAWRERPDGGTVTAACRFETGAIRHVLDGHFGGEEPWTRILNDSLVRRLVKAARDGVVPAGPDCRDFVAGVSGQIARSCGRPLLCVFLETALHFIDHRGQLRQNLRLQTRENILFVLESGAVAFVEITQPQADGQIPTVFRTAFFPRSVGWVSPKRAAEASIAHYITRWAEDEHHTGGLLLPNPRDGVRERDDGTGVEKQREYFRFVTPETWGFERQDDGKWVWFSP